MPKKQSISDGFCPVMYILLKKLDLFAQNR